MNKLFFSLLIPSLLGAHTLSELFNALKTHSQTKSDAMAVKKSDISKDAAYSKLYPSINLFGKYDNYTLPTGMIPLAPNNMLSLVQNPTHPAQPFSYNIYTEGVSVSMPIFVKSIYTMAYKAKAMRRSMAAKKRINLITNEALIVGENANFIYLSALKKALEGKERSLQETQKTVQMKVDNGRLGAFEVYKIDDALNQIAITKNGIDIQMQKSISSIESLTGISLGAPVEMQKTADISKNSFESLAPLRELIHANLLDLKAQKELLYPSLYAHGSYMLNQGTSYNNSTNVNEQYGDVGITLNIPLFEMNQYDAISLAEVEVRSSELQLQKSDDELSSKAKMLQNSLPLLENSQKLYKKSIEDKQKILDIAKVNYENGRLTTQDYLKFEDDVVSEKASLYQTDAAIWQTTMQLAVIYANNIEEIVQ